MRRTLRCDGIIPQYAASDGQSDGAREDGPHQVRAICAWLAEHGARPGFDVTVDGETPAADPGAAASAVARWADAGCTWWLETRWGGSEDLAERIAAIRERIAAGPPSSTRPEQPR
jgi:hypothetical protein